MKGKRLFSLLLALALCTGLLPMTAQAEGGGSTGSYQYTFEYLGTTYTIAACEWNEGDAMPPLQSSYDPYSGGMRGGDEETTFEFVIGISKPSGTGTGTVPADADIFAKVTGVSYTLDGKYLEGSVGTVRTSGTGYSVTRDTMLGTGSSVTTMGFEVTVPAKTYINMDATVTITLNLDGMETTLTQRFNIQKIRSDALGDRTLPLPADMGADELAAVLKDRTSIWTYYQKFYQCDKDTLQDAMGCPLWIYLPAGNFGKLTMDITLGNVSVGTESYGSYSAISIVGADSGTTFTSLVYTPDGTGMSNIGNIRFDGTALNEAESVGLAISSSEENWGGAVGVGGCAFTGYGTAISVAGYAAAGIANCTFTKNTTAVSLNGEKTKDVFTSSVGSCIFRQNGTGVLLNDLGNGNPYNFRVTGCDFIGNTLDVNYQVAGTFYLLDNYYASLENGTETLKRMATTMGSYTAGTKIVQGIWRTASTRSSTTSYGISDDGVVFNNSAEALDAAYLDDVSFDVITVDENGSKTVGTWKFE